MVFLIGAIIGTTFGGVINRALYEINPVLSDAFITTVYSLMLGFLGIVIFSLIFYVVYTLWYGFAIMFMFEGWGMRLEH